MQNFLIWYWKNRWVIVIAGIILAFVSGALLAKFKPEIGFIRWILKKL